MGISKDEALKKIEEAEADVNFEVFTEPEHQTYLENFAKTEVESRIGDEVSKIHSQYDADIEAILGERKEGTEKTYDFLKRKLKELKESSNTKPLKEKISKLEEDLKNKAGDERLKADYEELKQTYNADKESWEKKTQDLINQQEKMKIEIQLDAAAANLKFKDEIPDSVRPILIANAKQKLIDKAKRVDNDVIFVDDEGKTLVNKKNALNPFTPQEMFENELRDALGEKKEVTKPSTQSKSKDTSGVSVPDSVHTKEDLSEHLLSLGLTRNSDEYKKAYAELSPDLPYRK